MAGGPKNRGGNSKKQSKLKDEVCPQSVEATGQLSIPTTAIDTIGTYAVIIFGALTGLAQQYGHTTLSLWLFCLTIWLAAIALFAHGHEKRWRPWFIWQRPWLHSAFAGAVIAVLALFSVSADPPGANAVEQLTVDQRPWLGVDDIALSGFSADEELLAKVSVTNNGSTPATIVSYGGLFYVLKKGQRIPPQDSAHGDVMDTMNIAIPAGDNAVLNAPSGKANGQEYIDAIKRGELTLYSIGQVTYRDSEGGRYHTWWCYYLDLNTGGLVRAAMNNGMD
jgi:hypothetical protein